MIAVPMPKTTWKAMWIGTTPRGKPPPMPAPFPELLAEPQREQDVADDDHGQRAHDPRRQADRHPLHHRHEEGSFPESESTTSFVVTIAA